MSTPDPRRRGRGQIVEVDPIRMRFPLRPARLNITAHGLATGPAPSLDESLHSKETT